MNILIMGGYGFVGNLLSERLMESGEDDISRVSRRTGTDFTNYEQIAELIQLEKPDIIYNVAAHVGSVHYVTEYAADVLHDNMQMALNLYKAVSEHRPDCLVVNPLSNCSYPGDANTHYEPDWWMGEVHESVCSYANAKRMIYVTSKCYQKQYSVRSINFLVPNTFGPGDYTDPNKTHALNGMIIRMIKAQRNGDSEFEIWGSGSPIREWGYIDDVVSILLKAIEISEDLIYPVNIAQNKGYSIKESAQLIKKAVGFEGELTFNTKYQDGAPFKILDDRKFRSLFPDFVFQDHFIGIEKTVEYYKNVLK